MSRKYWVPAIERADKILNLVARQPGENRLIDISKKLDINKSSLFSLLNTLETLEWIKKEEGSTYSIGRRLGILSILYFSHFDLINTFSTLALETVDKLGESIQLSVLEGIDILYLAKKEGPSPVRLATDPGMKLPAHTTAMGKVHLSKYSYEQLQELYSDKTLKPSTEQTVTTLEELWKQILLIREQGFIWENQEAVENFTCIAAPIRNYNNEIIAALSATMLSSNYKNKQNNAEKLVVDLAKRISLKAGFDPINN